MKELQQIKKIKQRFVAVFSAAVLVMGGSITIAAPVYAIPHFQMPFPCGETWRASTYSGHNAIDWNMYPDDNNRPVAASAAGHATPFTQAQGGYMVSIDHGGGWKTVYAHLQQNGRASGPVGTGQVIGFVGNSGSATTGSHLHWEQTLNGVAQAPLYANGVALAPGNTANQSAPAYMSNNCAATTGFQTAFNSGTLWLHGTTVTTNTGLGMAAGTSPSIAKLTNGNHIVAFQANTGNLWLYGASIGTIDTGYGMKTGTSPSVTALPNGGYQVAFQANTGTLWVHGTAGTSNTGLGMVAGTSPSITTLSNGSYEVAFNSGNLWLYGSVTSNTGLGMMGGTSPAITHLPNNGYEVAFNSGNLWVYGTAATSNTGFGMAPGTSPSITTVNGGFQAAFNSGDLWVYGTTATSNTGLGMVAGTSPSITSVGNGYQVAINSGNLWVHGNVTTANTGYGMVAGTSPAVSN